jgi:hypothetical protein
MVGSVEPKHTCVGVTVKRGVARTQKWLLRKVPVSIYITKSTSAQAIVDAMKLKYQVPLGFSPPQYGIAINQLHSGRSIL